MNNRATFWVLTIFLGFIIQVTLSQVLAIRGVFPNLLLLATIFFAVRWGPVTGEWAGFVWGLMSDVASISIFGSQTFIFTLIGYIAGRLQGKVDEEKLVAQVTIVFSMSVLHLTGLYLIEALFMGSTQRFRTPVSIFQPIYSTAASPLVFWILMRWDRIFTRHGTRIRA